MSIRALSMSFSKVLLFFYTEEKIMNRAQLEITELIVLLVGMSRIPQPWEEDATSVVHSAFKQKADDVDTAIFLVNCLSITY